MDYIRYCTLARYPTPRYSQWGMFMTQVTYWNTCKVPYKMDLMTEFAHHSLSLAHMPLATLSLHALGSG